MLGGFKENHDTQFTYLYELPDSDTCNRPPWCWIVLNVVFTLARQRVTLPALTYLAITCYHIIYKGDAAVASEANHQREHQGKGEVNC